MNSENNYLDAERKAKNKTKTYLIFGIILWMCSLFFFLNQSKYEQSLIFAQILPSGWDSIPPVPIIVIDDSSKIDPNIDPNVVVLDTTDYFDTTKARGSHYSLRKFAPSVGNQGNLGSCVSWATAYAGFSIVRRIEERNPSLDPYSPLNLYVRYKKHFKEDPCSYGACVPFALNILKRKGCSLFKSFRNSCETNVSEDKEYVDKLYAYDGISPSNIKGIKSAIAANMPVVIAIKCYSGDSWQNAVLDDGLWSGYFSGNCNSGHAMCLIGYDDNKGGGAFEIMNSWGPSWGDQGFFWIKYEDFPKHVDECYALVAKRKKKK
jgi:C1A family cysteine protease